MMSDAAPAPAAKKGKVLFDYEAQEEDELTIRSGEHFNLLKAYDDGWWLIEANEEIGMVPSNYVHVEADKHEHRSNRSSRTHLHHEIEHVTSPEKARSNHSSRTHLPVSPAVEEELVSPERVIVKKKSQSVLQSPPPMTVDEETPRYNVPSLPRSPEVNTSRTTSGQSPELKRLKDLREQATAKIDALR